MRILGIDYGDARIGLALSDPLGMIAGALETYTRKGTDADIAYFKKLVSEKEVSLLVVGLPKNMDGSLGPRAVATKEFGDALAAALGLPVKYKDERLSTVSAEKVLISADVRREKRKNLIDKVAAQIILQSYLDGAPKPL